MPNDAAKAPLKYIDMKDMLKRGVDQSLAMTILPGQGQIPATNYNMFPNALPLPMGFAESLAGGLGQMKEYLFNRPGTAFLDDRQQAGYFANIRDQRERDVGL